MIEERFLRFYDILCDDAFTLTSEVSGGITMKLTYDPCIIPTDRLTVSSISKWRNTEERFKAEMPKLLTGQKTYFGITQVSFKPDFVALTIENLALEHLHKEIDSLTDQYGGAWASIEAEGNYPEALSLYIDTDDGISVKAHVDIKNLDETVDHYEISVGSQVRLTEYAASTVLQRTDPEFDPYAYDRKIWRGHFSYADMLNKLAGEEQRYMQLEIERERRAPLL